VRSLVGGRDGGLDPCLFPSFDRKELFWRWPSGRRCESDLGGRLGSLRTNLTVLVGRVLLLACVVFVLRECGPSSLLEWRWFSTAWRLFSIAFTSSRSISSGVCSADTCRDFIKFSTNSCGRTVQESSFKRVFVWWLHHTIGVSLHFVVEGESAIRFRKFGFSIFVCGILCRDSMYESFIQSAYNVFEQPVLDCSVKRLHLFREPICG